MATLGQRLLNAAGERILTTDGLQRNSDGTDECDTAEISGVEVLKCSDDSGTGDYWQTSVALTETVYVWKDGAPGECYYVPDGVAPTTPIPGPTFAYTHAALNCTDCDFADNVCDCDDFVYAPDTWRVTLAGVSISGGCCSGGAVDIGDLALAASVNQTYDIYRSDDCTWERQIVLSNGTLNVTVNDTATPDCSGDMCGTNYTVTLVIKWGRLPTSGGFPALQVDVEVSWDAAGCFGPGSYTISAFFAYAPGDHYHCDGRSVALTNDAAAPANCNPAAFDGMSGGGGTASLTAQ